MNLCVSVVNDRSSPQRHGGITEDHREIFYINPGVMNDQSPAQHYLADAIRTFRDYKKLAEGAFGQINDEDFFRTLDKESNSIAVNIKHLAGNMLSRWTDFLTTDGEKPERDRDMEFEMLPGTTKADMLAYWEHGWERVFEAIGPLQPDDLMLTIRIR